MEPFGSGRLVVEGETFDVTASKEYPGQHDLTWRSGPNPGYGFACRRSDERCASEAELVESIRDFLANVNPVTGYLD